LNPSAASLYSESLHAFFIIDSHFTAIIRSKKELPEETVNQIKPLSDLKHDQKGRVALVQPAAPNDLQKLLRAGILPDAFIRVVDNTFRYGMYIVDHNVIALDRQTASGIFVQVV
jgi:Fe2+ transport system protein FeoA